MFSANMQFQYFQIVDETKVFFFQFLAKKGSQNIIVFMVMDSKPLFSYCLQTLVCSSFSNLFTTTINSFLQITEFLPLQSEVIEVDDQPKYSAGNYHRITKLRLLFFLWASSICSLITRAERVPNFFPIPTST